MEGYLDVLAVDEVSDGQMKEAEVDGHKVLVAKVGGSFYISDAHCPHLHGNLTKGTLEGTVVTCPLHGSQFDLVDGRVIRWTKWHGTVQTMAAAVRHPRPLRVYETLVEDGRVLLGPQKQPPEINEVPDASE